MKVVNESHRPLSQVLPLVEFVSARMQYADLAYLHLHPAQYDVDGEVLVGRAQALKYNDNPAGSTPSRVDMWPSEGASYPGRNYYPEAAVGWVIFTSWEEEFAFTLAHELRHIDQFWWTRPLPANIEHDAESFAFEVLNAWRRANGRAVIRPLNLPRLRPQKAPASPVRIAARKGATRG